MDRTVCHHNIIHANKNKGEMSGAGAAALNCCLFASLYLKRTMCQMESARNTLPLLMGGMEQMGELEVRRLRLLMDTNTSLLQLGTTPTDLPTTSNGDGDEQTFLPHINQTP
jgi:hypothetical protein